MPLCFFGREVMELKSPPIIQWLLVIRGGEKLKRDKKA
jgi:hypothetical protein